MQGEARSAVHLASSASLRTISANGGLRLFRELTADSDAMWRTPLFSGGDDANGRSDSEVSVQRSKSAPRRAER
jgi:hypothetical protein